MKTSRTVIQNSIRVYDMYNQLIRISDSWGSDWTLDDLKRIAQLQMSSAVGHVYDMQGAHFVIKMIDGTEYRSDCVKFRDAEPR